MAYQTPITIKEALARIHRHEFVLPAIQREYVWKPKQIAKLFDSLMRGYPIGAFLFWKVEPGHVHEYQYYDFVLHYHQRDSPHCPPLSVPSNSGVVAILDGQQRLTALNIGLRGSHAEKEPRKWWNNPDAFPRKQLYLNVLAEAEENEEGMLYDFRFLTPERAGRTTDGHYWFPVSEILDMATAVEIFRYLQERRLTENSISFPLLERLHSVVHKEGVVAYYEEKEPDLDKVLNIFIRTNSGGTVLSYSDLLLSIATAQWNELDARSAIYDLVDELNRTRNGFTFSKDFVLKAGLMLADIASVGFKVTNFNQANMKILESKWTGIAQALRLTVRLVAGFGFSGQTLGADSSLLPIAYYLYHRKATQAYPTSPQTQEDRETIRRWLIRSLLKSGVWGSGLDTLLTLLRTAIQENEKNRFPVEAIETAMIRRGRNLRFEEDEIEDLLEVSYGDRRAFALLTLLYSFVDLRNEFHIDHIFPKSRFTPRRLERAGVTSDRISEYRDDVNRLPNLQLLEGTLNQSKGDQLPASWLRTQFSDASRRAAFRERHDLGEIPEDVTGFSRFYEERRLRIMQKLGTLLNDSTE